jgi:hypothetical protein
MNAGETMGGQTSRARTAGRAVQRRVKAPVPGHLRLQCAIPMPDPRGLHS